MKNRKVLQLATVLALFMFATACDHMGKVAAKVGGDTVIEKKEAVKTYDAALVDNLKDPTCGMPVSAGINDTAHYKDKVLGFCSAECKAEFKKNPEAALASAELKKK